MYVSFPDYPIGDYGRSSSTVDAVDVTELLNINERTKGIEDIDSMEIINGAAMTEIVRVV